MVEEPLLAKVIVLVLVFLIGVISTKAFPQTVVFKKLVPSPIIEVPFKLTH